MTRRLSVGETVALYDIADTSIGAQLVMKAPGSRQREHPLCEVRKQLPVEPPRNTEPKKPRFGKTRSPRQGNTVVVVPGEKVFLGRSVRIDGVINNRGRAVDDPFASADQPFSEFPIFAGNSMAAAVSVR